MLAASASSTSDRRPSLKFETHSVRPVAIGWIVRAGYTPQGAGRGAARWKLLLSGLGDAREVDHGNGVFHGDCSPVDLGEELEKIGVFARCGIFALDLSRGDLAQAFHLDAVDHRREDPLLCAEPSAHGDPDQLALPVFIALVSQTDRQRLPTVTQRLRKDARI